MQPAEPPLLRAAGIDPGSRNMGMCEAAIWLDGAGKMLIRVDGLALYDLKPGRGSNGCRLASLAGAWFANLDPARCVRTWFVELNTVPNNPVNHVCSALFAAGAALDREVREVPCPSVKKLVRAICARLGTECEGRRYADNKRHAAILSSVLLGHDATHHEADALFALVAGIVRTYANAIQRLELSSSFCDREFVLACSRSDLATLL